MVIVTDLMPCYHCGLPATGKDLDGDGVIEAMGALGQELFSCPPP
jgi:hypothetical protein